MSIKKNEKISHIFDKWHTTDYLEHFCGFRWHENDLTDRH